MRQTGQEKMALKGRLSVRSGTDNNRAAGSDCNRARRRSKEWDIGFFLVLLADLCLAMTERERERRR